MLVQRHSDEVYNEWGLLSYQYNKQVLLVNKDHVPTARRTDRQTDRQTDGQTEEQTDRQKDRQRDEQTDRQTERQTDGRMDRRTAGWMDKLTDA